MDELSKLSPQEIEQEQRRLARMTGKTYEEFMAEVAAGSTTRRYKSTPPQENEQAEQ